jgi:biopolymer transport protein ExbD
MKVPSVQLRERTALNVAMTPMIDVVFLLLVFFVWNASFQVVEYSLQSRVSESQPTAATGTANDLPLEELDFEEVRIRIRGPAGRVSWLLNQETLGSLSLVRDRLQAIHAIRADAPIVIQPDPVTPLADVVALYDLAKLVGFPQVSLTAEETTRP